MITNATGLQVNSDVSFNGTDYLVVWEDLRQGGVNSPDIYGRGCRPPEWCSIHLRIARSAPLRLGSTHRQWPRRRRHSLVVWEDVRAGNSDIYATRVDVTGAALNPAGIPISTLATTGKTPVVEFDGTNFFTVWADSRNGTFDIYGAG